MPRRSHTTETCFVAVNNRVSLHERPRPGFPRSRGGYHGHGGRVW